MLMPSLWTVRSKQITGLPPFSIIISLKLGQWPSLKHFAPKHLQQVQMACRPLMIYAGWQNVTKIMPLLDIGHTAHGLCPTCVTFSVTLCVRSMSLQGAMMSISPEGRAMSGSGLKSTKLSVIWGILEMVRYRMRSESDVEFSMFNLLFTAPGNMQMKFNNQVRKPAGKHLIPPAPSHRCCCWPAGCLAAGSSDPIPASWPRSRLRRRRDACCESFLASGCATENSWRPSLRGWGWAGGGVLRRVWNGWGDPPGGLREFDVVERLLEAQSTIRCVGLPGGLQANSVALTWETQTTNISRSERLQCPGNQPGHWTLLTEVKEFHNELKKAINTRDESLWLELAEVMRHRQLAALQPVSAATCSLKLKLTLEWF